MLFTVIIILSPGQPMSVTSQEGLIQEVENSIKNSEKVFLRGKSLRKSSWSEWSTSKQMGLSDRTWAPGREGGTGKSNTQELEKSATCSLGNWGPRSGRTAKTYERHH